MSAGIKYDAGKARPDLVLGDFMLALEHPVFVGTFGACKYAPRNFQTLDEGQERYAEAAFRHYMSRKKAQALGDDTQLFDKESGELHIGHEIWDKIAELYFWLKENGDRQWEKAIRGKSGLYYHISGEWSEYPYWFDEDSARQVIWGLAREEKGELSISVEVREVDKTSDCYYLIQANNDLFYNGFGFKPDRSKAIKFNNQPSSIIMDSLERRFPGYQIFFKKLEVRS